MANEIITEIRLELDNFRKDLKDGIAQAKDAGKKSGDDFGEGVEKGLSSAFGGIKSQLLALAGTIGGAFAFKETIKAASEQEQAINGLSAAMALNGKYSEEAITHFENFSSALQKTTGVADEVIQSGAKLLVSIGGLSGGTLDRAAKSALDLSAALGIDVNTAFQKIAQGAEGNLGFFHRYGIEVTKTGDKAKDFEVALGKLETKFKGMAELQANTFDGAMRKTQSQFGEVLESLGNLVIKSPTVITVLNKLADLFAKAAEAITKWAAGRDVINELGTVLVKFGGYVNTYLVAPLEFAYNLLKTGVLTIATAFTGLITVLGYVGQAINDYLIKPVIDFIGGALGKLISLVDKDLGASITAFVEQTTASMGAGFGMIAEKAGAATASLAETTSKAAEGVFNFDVAKQTEEFLAKSQEFFDGVKPAVVTGFQEISDASKKLDPTFFDKFAEGFKNASKTMVDTAKALGAQVNATFVQGMTNAFVAMGGAMAKGEAGFKEFAKSMLSVLADIIIQSGAAFIGLGVARLAVSYGLDPTGYALISAGGALAVLGGAIKAMVGGGGAASAGAAATPASGGGGGAAASSASMAAPGTDHGQAPVDEAQRNEVGTKVNVNINGNVFDRKETGMQIVDIINESFGSHGTVLAAGV